MPNQNSEPNKTGMPVIINIASWLIILSAIGEIFASLGTLLINLPIGLLRIVLGIGFIIVGVGLRRLRPWALYALTVLTMVGIVVGVISLRSKSVADHADSIIQVLVVIYAWVKRNQFRVSGEYSVSSPPPRRRIVITLIVVLALAMLAIVPALYNFIKTKQFGADWKTLEDTRIGYRFKYPSGWCIASRTENVCDSNQPQILVSAGNIEDIPADLEIGMTRSYLNNLNGAIERREVRAILFNGGKGSFAGLTNVPGGGSNPIYVFTAVKGGKYLEIRVTDTTVSCPEKKDEIRNELRTCAGYFNKIVGITAGKVADPKYAAYNIFLDLIQKTLRFN